MSDCSSEAMKPKERPKTCGTCGWFALEPGKLRSGACLGSYSKCLRAYKLTSVHRCEGEQVWCPGWRSKGSDTLEQRYQQLEQVARDMYTFISINEILNGTTLRGQAKPADKIMCRSSFQDQLESLGVSVDD